MAEPMASMVAPTPAEVTERAVSSVAGVEQPAEDRIPPVKVIVTAPSQDQPGAVAVAPEGVVQSAPPGAHVDPPVAPEAVQTEEGPAGGSSSAAVVPHRVRRVWLGVRIEREKVETSLSASKRSRVGPLGLVSVISPWLCLA